MIEVIPNWHPYLVHFTVALFLSAALFFVIAKAMPGTPWCDGMTKAANWNLWLGAALTIVTYFAGRQAFGTVAHDEPSHAAMVIHATWGTYTALAILALAAWSIFANRKGWPVSWLFVGFMLLASLALLNTGFKGADLVFRHGLGVMSLPEQADHVHDEHEDGAVEPEDEHGDHQHDAVEPEDEHGDHEHDGHEEEPHDH